MIDTHISFAWQDDFYMWLDAAVHAYALYMMWQGFAAARELAQLQQALQPGLSQPKLP